MGDGSLALSTIVPDLRDIEQSWKARQQAAVPASERTRRLIGWWLLTAVVAACWLAAWLGWGAALGRGLQALYGVDVRDAAWLVRSDTHLHMVVAALVTVWAAWAGRLFTPVGSWLGPPVTLVVIMLDEVLQLGEAGRSFQWEDMLAGALGMVVAMVVIVSVTRRRGVGSVGKR